MTLTNTGNAVTNPGGSGVINYGLASSGSISGALTTTTTSNINAGGGNLQVTYTFTTATPTAGTTYTGYVALANGAQVQFAGTFAA